jgi:hypothetical protein
MRASRFTAISVSFLAGLMAVSAAAQERIEVLGGGRQPLKKVKGSAVGAQPALSDEDALKKANLSADDGEKLIEYLKQRTLTESEQGRIAEIIKRFGADDFDERVKATEEIELFGPAAIGPLKVAAKSSDPEIAYRARLALKKVETVPHTAVASAAVRAIIKLKPEGAAAALVGFLPLADDETVAELIRGALVSLAVNKDGKPDPGLVAALDDVAPVRRAAAYVALVQGGPATERIRIKESYPKVREAVLKDPDPEAKFAGLWSLVLTTREKEYVPELVALIPKLGRGRIWQLEDLLLQLAGSHPKDGRFLKSAESLAKSSNAWLAWWKAKGKTIDLVNLDYKPRVTGVTDIIEMDMSGLSQARIISLGPDMKEKWRIGGVYNPNDMRVGANGRVYVVELNYNRITERGTTGNVIHQYRNLSGQPVNVHLLANGGFLVVCRHIVIEYDKDWGQSWVYNRPNGAYDTMAGVRLPGGETLLVVNTVVNNQQQTKGVFLDAKGKQTDKSLTFGQVYNLHVADVVGEDRVLICESNKVAEYDVKTGKQTWKYDCNNPSSCQRLPNGNTLIALVNQGSGGQVIEVDPSGEVVWDYQSKDGLRAGRAYRR